MASGSGSGGRLSKAGVSGRAGQELPPINLPSPRELLRGFAFCLANYSASTLFLSWGAGALCRALIKRKPLSQLPQGWGCQQKPWGLPSRPKQWPGASSQGRPAPTMQVEIICPQTRKLGPQRGASVPRPEAPSARSLGLADHSPPAAPQDCRPFPTPLKAEAWAAHRGRAAAVLRSHRQDPGTLPGP